MLHAKFLRKTENLEITYKRSRLLYSSSSRAMSDLLSTYYVKYDQMSVTVGVLLMTAVRTPIIQIKKKIPEIFATFRPASYSCVL